MTESATLQHVGTTLQRLPIELLFQIFSWIHPVKVFQFRSLSSRINDVLLTRHFANLVLERIPTNQQPQSHEEEESFNRYRAMTLMEHAFMLAPPSFQAVYASKWLRQATIINWTSRFACPTTHYYYRIPYSSFGELQNLVELKLTRLCGVIPKEIGELGALRTLSLNFNPLLTGPVPKELGNLKRLVVLDLSRCGLVGELPYEIGDLTALETLSLNGNKLEGAIPSSIGNLKNLRKLHLGWNGFSGLIPKEIGALENLETFAIHYNHACGEVPAEFGKLKALCFVNMASNLLSGPVPSEIRLLPHLRMFNLQKNPGITCSFDLSCLLL